jgi:hypothetical protein
LILVGAVVVALVLVGTAVVFNSVLHTASIAPQSSTLASDNARTYEVAATRDLQRLTRSIANGSDSADIDLVRENTTEYARRLSASVARDDAAAVDLTFNRTLSTVNARIVQSDPGKLTDEGNANDWNLVDPANATTVTEFYQRVWLDDANTSATTGQAYEFTVENTTTGDTWTIKLFKNPPSSTTLQELENGVVVNSCSYPDSGFVEINRTAIDGPGLVCNIDFASGVDPPYVLSIANGNKVTGDYSITVASDVDRSVYFDESAGNDPYINEVVTRAKFDYEYDSPTLEYHSTLTVGVDKRVAPHSGSTLLYSNFEDGSLGPDWTLAGAGSAGVDSATSHTGARAAYHTGPTDGRLETTGGYNTSSYDEVVVEYWVQEGLPGGPTAGPETSEGEDLTVQYYNGTAWTTIDTITAIESGPPRTYYRTFRLGEPAVTDDFRLRFVTPADNNNDQWYVDDVLIRGWVRR